VLSVSKKTSVEVLRLNGWMQVARTTLPKTTGFTGIYVLPQDMNFGIPAIFKYNARRARLLQPDIPEPLQNSDRRSKEE
jgi:hypothetical protein